MPSAPPGQSPLKHAGEAAADHRRDWRHKPKRLNETMQLAEHVVEEMQKPYVLVLYLLCLVAVAMHLYHAVGSSLQTLGAGSSRFGQAIWYLGRAFAVVVGGGFILLALWVGFIADKPMIPDDKPKTTKPNAAMNPAAEPVSATQPIAEPPVVENR